MLDKNKLRKVLNLFIIKERKIIIGLIDEFRFEVKCERASEIASGYDFL